MWINYLDVFLSARPERGATTKLGEILFNLAKFLSARPERGATQYDGKFASAGKFLSARPERGATGSERGDAIGTWCFYPHAPSGARQLAKCFPV